MPKQLAIVVGAARGSGRTAARALARHGLQVVVWDVNPDAVDRLVDEIVAGGGSAEPVLADITNKMAAQTALYTLLDRHPKIDVLVNAGEIEPRTPALRMDEGEWDRTLDVGVKGAFIVAQTVARAMQVTGGGLIVNVLRQPAAHAAVTTARAGLAALTDALAAEWAEYGVRVVGLPAAEAETVAALIAPTG